MGVSGRITQAFLTAQLTPLLALLGVLMGLFAIFVTPKEEEPQIDVTFANVFIPFPGASVGEVERLVTTPAEQVLTELSGVDHVFSNSRPGMAVLTIQFKVGEKRNDVVLRLYDKIYSHADWLPPGLGVGQPLIKPKGIDDVPIVSLTLSNPNQNSAWELTQVAHSLETELKHVSGTRDIYTIGGQNTVVKVTLDPAKLAGYGIGFDQLKRSLSSNNSTFSETQVIENNQVELVKAGEFFQNINELKQLIVSVTNGNPVYLSDVASIDAMPEIPSSSVATMNIKAGQTDFTPAVTLAIAKQPGRNAVDIADAVVAKVEKLKNSFIPADVKVEITRNYGATAQEKSNKLIGKLLFATSAVVALVFFALGGKEAIIVGVAVVITLLITLFTSWAFGFTINRVSLFALIFSIGILVDDAIVVVENIHRHRARSNEPLLALIPRAVDEVGSPTILATLTVIAALMPMAFVSGLMGPYMSPIPINASAGMLISLAVAFIITPWLSGVLLKNTVHHEASTATNRWHAVAVKIIAPFIHPERGNRMRWLMLSIIMSLILIAVALPVLKLVVLKMLPFDNKSELQVVVDMPEDSPMENTRRVLVELSNYLKTVPEVESLQIYAGTSAPINFNGLVRQYYLRNAPYQGDIQVNLVDKHHRSKQSHDIALSLREPLQAIAKKLNANIKLTEVPPGPPVMSPLVAEVYGATAEVREATVNKLLELFKTNPDIVDADSSMEANVGLKTLVVDRQKASLLGLEYAAIIDALQTSIAGTDISYLHSENAKYAIPIRLSLAESEKNNLDAVLAIKIKNREGALVPLSDVVTVKTGVENQTIYHKDLLPVSFVTADVAGKLDSPLYGMFSIVGAIDEQKLAITQNYIKQPDYPVGAAIKWDGEWQITYETFRDMGIAYGVGMVLIYLLIVAQFRSYLVPLIIMAPIPLTIIGVMPGHALFGAQFTATSMIGMIALAGIIVRNSILLVDFIQMQVAAGTPLADAVVNSAAIRAKPILLTAFAASIGAFFILDDPIFNGLAISLIFGVFISTLLTLWVIPVVYYAYKQ